MDRDDWIELVVAIASVIVMLAVMVVIGTTYGGTGGVLSVEGGFALAGAILFFVVFMTAIGYGLAYFLKDDENGDDGNPA